MNILLLNPPGKKLYLRQYYCSQISKANYLYQPIDLVILAGILSKKHSVKVLDAIVERLNFNDCFKRIIKINFDMIIFLTGAVSWADDIRFVKKIYETEKQGNKKIKIMAIGDILLGKSKEKLREVGFLDAVIKDFTSLDILSYLDGNYKKITTIDYKKNRKIVQTKPKKHKTSFRIPMPRHDLFLNYPYRHVFMKKHPLATVLTDYGCPYKCTFCIFGTLNYKYRPVDDVIEELRYLKSLGVKEIFFLDQTFGAIKKRTTELCTRMIENNFGFSWFCFSRVDVLDYSALELMKRAGCHTIMFGVESANESLLKEYKKGYTKGQIKKTFRIAKKLGIQTMGTFLIGLPEEDKKSAMETIKFARQLGCDFASFNIAVPRINTGLREKAIKEKLISPDFYKMDQSGSFISMPTTKMTKEDIKKIRRKALLTFYFSPSYILRRISNIRTWTELRTQVSEAVALIKNILSENEF